ncbi:MAG: molybdate ABC transporter substrate-binding protein [Mogibacterium sp.]|nr:molybdate ABC transporter substrate-binding protein [Mogibacterium sp.]MBQ6500951.1 molybdate ABC transporter substrate-binding protein [Mogibacterium sp.]
MKRKLFVITFILALVFIFTACGSQGRGEEPADDRLAVNVFAAASLSNVMAEFEAAYEEANPGVDIVVNADSSGALLTQIQEGAPCDVFFSAAQKQMDELEGAGMVVEGTRTNVVNNQLVVVTQPDSDTAVTGLADIGNAKSIALADGSVPVGKYTRQAMINLGLLAEVEDPASITTQEVSDQLGGVEISEQGNVSKVLSAVEEASCEVGTTYLSDTVGHEDGVKILEVVGYDVTGNIIYPVAQIANPDADDAESAAAADFIAFITNDDAKALYQQYGFDTNVE